MTRSNPSTPSKTPSKTTVGGSYLKKKRDTSRLTTTPDRAVGDRFIPSRAASSPVAEHYRSRTLFDTMDPESIFDSTLHSTLFGQAPSTVLSYGDQKTNTEPTVEAAASPMTTTTTTPQHNIHTTKRQRKPNRILDAPEMIDDFYLNLVAWSSQNVLAVAMRDAVYLQNENSGDSHLLHSYAEDEGDVYVCSVEWVGAHFLAIGVSDGGIDMFDVETNSFLREMWAHTTRVSSLASRCSKIPHSLASGSREGCLVHHDVRVKKHIVSKAIAAHGSEICTLKWSPDKKLLASGGNDDTVRIWDYANLVTDRLAFQKHKAAVKAIAWSPTNSNLIATGGGSDDKTIKIWNVVNGHVRKSINTTSQVTSLAWSPNEPDHLLSAHGYKGYGLTLWQLPSFKTVQTFHIRQNARPTCVVLCPNNSSVCVPCSDEALRIWDNVFVARPRPPSDDGSFLTDQIPCLQMR